MSIDNCFGSGQRWLQIRPTIMCVHVHTIYFGQTRLIECFRHPLETGIILLKKKYWSFLTFHTQFTSSYNCISWLELKMIQKRLCSLRHSINQQWNWRIFAVTHQLGLLYDCCTFAASLRWLLLAVAYGYWQLLCGFLISWHFIGQKGEWFSSFLVFPPLRFSAPDLEYTSRCALRDKLQ